MINYHDLPIRSEIKSFIAEWLPYQNEGPAMEIHSDVERVLETMHNGNPFEYGLLRHLETIIGFIYEYCDGFDVDGESYTPGLDSSDDGSLERHIEMTATQQMQSYVNVLSTLHQKSAPNRLFPNV